jgi:hypothetical protein
MATPRDFTFWDLIYTPMLIAAELIEDIPLHEVALPITEKTIKAWNAEEDDWVVPRFRIDTDNMQGALRKEIGRLYKNVVATYSKNTNKEFVPWEVVQGH